jgi:hypothetical protein
MPRRMHPGHRTAVMTASRGRGLRGCSVKKLCVLICLPFFSLFGGEYYAKAEPYEIRTVASNVSGLVMLADETREGKRLGSGAYIRIDDELDRVELEKTRAKIVLLKNAIALNSEMAANYERIIAKKALNYERVQALKMRSQVEKDREFYDYVATQNQLLALRKESENMQIQINDLQIRQRRLERNIADKSLRAPGYVLYALLVKEDQVVTPGTPLAQIADVSRARLTLYLNGEDRERVMDQTIYLDGKKSPYRIERLWNIADAKQLSSYRAEIIIDAPEQFSHLVKVEFRDE